MSYLKDLKLILTLHVNQFLINMEKRIFALLRGYWLCRQKRLRQKLFELAVCDQFESSHRSLSNVIVVLISSPPPLLPSSPPPPRSKHGFYTHFTRPQTGVGEGGEDLSLFWYRTPSSFNKHSIVHSQPFFWSKRPISYRESDIGSQIPFCSLERKRYLALMFHNT